MQRVRPVGPVVAMTLAAALGLTACGSDKEKTEPASSSSSTTPEDVRAAAATVAAGLATIKTTTADIATTLETDAADAKESVEKIEPAWEPIEGTIKVNDQNAYLTFEDNFAQIEGAVEKGDVAKAKAAADTIATTADTYLGTYSG